MGYRDDMDDYEEEQALAKKQWTQLQEHAGKAFNPPLALLGDNATFEKWMATLDPTREFPKIRMELQIAKGKEGWRARQQELDAEREAQTVIERVRRAMDEHRTGQPIPAFDAFMETLDPGHEVGALLASLQRKPGPA